MREADILEKAEIERRRNLSEEERLAEDTALGKFDKPEKPKWKFMQVTLTVYTCVLIGRVRKSCRSSLVVSIRLVVGVISHISCICEHDNQQYVVYMLFM